MSMSNPSPKKTRAIAAFAVLLVAASGSAFAAEKIGTTKAGAAVYSYDSCTDKGEVFTTLRKIVADTKGGTKLIYVITGTHGASDGTVTKGDAEVAFKKEDLDSASITSKSIIIKDYTLLSVNTWKDLSGKGQNCILVLAWCYSKQWLSNKTLNGNNGKIAMP